MNLQEEFPLNKGMVYLNHAAVSPWPQRTVKAVQAFAEENGEFGALNYDNWVKTEQSLRKKLQTLINAPSASDIALLKNTSEALSVVAYGLPWQEGDNIVILGEEFLSNRIVWESLSKRGVETRIVQDSENINTESALFQLVDRRTRLISVSSVQYGTGLRLDLAKIGEFCRSKGILFCVDAIQSIGAINFDVQAIGADFVMADGHKWMLGPEGVALFYCRKELAERLDLKQYGWHMVEDLGNYDNTDWKVANDARRFECGSPNMTGIHALDASISLLLEVGMDEIEKQITDRSDYLIDNLDRMKKVQLLSPSRRGRYAGITNFKLKKLSTEALYEELRSKGVYCAFRNGGIRLSPHFYTSMDDINEALNIIYRRLVL